MKINQLSLQFIVFSLLLIPHIFFAQVGINSTGTAPSADAMLDVNSANKGVLIPRLSSAALIASPTLGLIFYNTSTNQFNYFNGTSWIAISGNTTNGNPNFWQQAGLGGNEIQNTNSGGFWSANPTGLNYNSTDETNPLTAPVSGAGTRLMWIPSRSAFRVGTADNSWDAANIGLFSFASGIYTKANGESSTAMGTGTTASGNFSTAMGEGTTASGDESTAMGVAALATGFESIAMGSNITASGNFSTAMGYGVTTNLQQGGFIIGDRNPTGQGLGFVGSHDQFVARFYNGYYLVTSGFDLATRTGVFIGNGQSAWASISDSTRKEKFIAANGEDFLVKLRHLRLGSWNYKLNQQNPERFYGPMAQEIFAAYGKDELGKIGTDTTVSTINMDGILFIFAQALEKRTQKLQEENEKLKSQLIDIRQEDTKLKSQLSDIQQVVNRVEKLEALLNDDKWQVSRK